MKIRHVLAALFALIAASAPATAPTYAAPTDIVERRDQFDGQTVTLGGVLARDGDGACLLDERASLDGGISRARIAIVPGPGYRFTIVAPFATEPDRPMRDQNAANAAGRFVFVEGIFRAHASPGTTAARSGRCSDWEIEANVIRYPAPRSLPQHL
jgi:hypothetical protein